MMSIGGSETLRKRALALLRNYAEELKKPDVREKVLALIPVFKALRHLGKSLLPSESSSAAKSRILAYFKKYPLTVIKGDEILVISGIQDWPRRLRELRVQEGWAIIDGISIKEMLEEGDLEETAFDAGSMKPSDYVLIEGEQDLESAYRWHIANKTRKSKATVKKKMLDYFLLNIGKEIRGDELRYVAKSKTEWARRVRELRTEQGWPIVTKLSGRPDIKNGFYMMLADRQSPEHDRVIIDSVRSEVLRRDGYLCQKCAWSRKEWDESDPRHLELHHISPHVQGGVNEAKNLITLCTVCHDKIHRK